MQREPKLLEELFGQKLGDGCCASARPGCLLVALEGRLVWAVEDEDRVYGQGYQAQEAVVEGAQGGVRAACRRKGQRGRAGRACGRQRSPLLAWIWKSQMETSIAMRKGRPVCSNVSAANLERATRRPGPISWYILQQSAHARDGRNHGLLTPLCPLRCHGRRSARVLAGALDVAWCVAWRVVRCCLPSTALSSGTVSAAARCAMRRQAASLDCCCGNDMRPRPQHDPDGRPTALHTWSPPTHGAFLARATMPPRHALASEPEPNADSSPDPLAASFDRDRPRARPDQQPRAASSPGKQQHRVHLSSPTKQMLLSTPRTAGHSPWRIKVTVQAEPGSDSEAIESPIVHHITHTKTTTIPLKDPDASSPVKRRGRPRKSDATPARSATPVRRRAASKPRRPSLGDTSAADVDTEATPKKRRGRPRKVQPPADDDIWGQARRSSAGALVETDFTPRKRRGRPPKSIQPPVQEDHVSSDELLTPQSSPAPASAGSELHNMATSGPCSETHSYPVPRMPASREQGASSMSTPDQASPPRRLKARVNTPVAKSQEWVEISSAEDYEEGCDMDSESPVFERQHRQHTSETHFAPSTQEARAPDAEDFQLEDDTGFAFDEGVTRMPDDTTVIDSENFSMISVDSLPSCASAAKPAPGAAGDGSSSIGHEQPRREIYLGLPSDNLHGISDPRTNARETLPAPPRYKTPSVEPVDLSQPPPVAAAPTISTEAQTPRIGRVVKAGVALQGLLEPNRVTPEAGASKNLDDRLGHLDDLFRGFSERTRKELHAGLRLGEQLAKQNGTKSPSSSSRCSINKSVMALPQPPTHIVANTTSHSSRLLTPEDQDGDTTLEARSIEVHYPALADGDQGSGLLSPVSSPDEDDHNTSWGVDTSSGCLPTGTHTQLSALHQSSEAARLNVADLREEHASSSPFMCENENAHKGYARQDQVLYTHGGTMVSAHRHGPGMRQSKSSNDLPRSDQAVANAEADQLLPKSSIEPDEPTIRSLDQDRAEVIPNSTPRQLEDDDDKEDVEDLDDTGMFYQANLSDSFNKKRRGESRRRRPPQPTISLNLDESLLPESSPPPASVTLPTSVPNPFTDTPPRLAVVHSSPIKSSPLRQELRSSDISSDSILPTFEESTLPLAPSSPFHTYVEDDTGLSMASDQRQLMHEMAQPDSSLHRIRIEADEYLDAYMPQERSLHNLTEVTEPSRTWIKDSAIILPNSQRHPQYAPKSGLGRSFHEQNPPVGLCTKENTDTSQQQSDVSDIHTSNGLPTSRTSSSLPDHPTLSKLKSLPAVEPWTKTHYKTLDKLYQLYKKQPCAFSTSEAPNASLNATLVDHFLIGTAHSYIGARYRAWGYNVIFTESLVVVCAAFMQLLACNSLSVDKARTAKQIQVDIRQLDTVGRTSIQDVVVERLATIILGEAVRRDEKNGKIVNRSGCLRVEYK